MQFRLHKLGRFEHGAAVDAFEDYVTEIKLTYHSVNWPLSRGVVTP